MSSSFYPSANMSLPVPSVGIDPGPDYASNINACMTLIDEHDHSLGKGVALTPSGLNINSDLPLNSNNLISVRSVRLARQSAVLSGVSDLNCINDVNGDLYFNDGAGNKVRITQSGGVAGSPGSIANLTSPASASYVSLSSTFVWQSAASTPANMDAASIILRNLSASSKGLTISPPNAMAADYSITLPALPGVTSFLMIDASGNMGVPLASVGGIGTNQLANGAVTSAKIEAVNYATTGSSGNFLTSSQSYVDVSSLSESLTITGRPVQISFVSDNSGTNPANISVAAAFGSTECQFRILRDGSEIASYELGANAGSGIVENSIPPGALNTTDTGAAAGSHIWKLQVKCVGSGQTAFVSYIKMIVYEIH